MPKPRKRQGKSLLDLMNKKFCFGELPTPEPPPGFYRYISSEQLNSHIEKVKLTSLFPVLIKEKEKEEKDFTKASNEKMAFSKIGKGN